MDPAAAQDASTKNYVDTQITGIGASNFLKKDGSVALTANWSAGAFSATHNSVVVGSAANQISGLATIINTGTLTLPAGPDTLVGRATTDTLTNKTLTAPVINGAATGSGSFVETANTAATVPLTLKGAAAQTGNLLEVQNQCFQLPVPLLC